MKNELQALDVHLREKRPDYYKKLQKPLTDQEISKLEVQYGIALPGDLKALYQWKNGQQQDCYETFVMNSMFEPLENVLENNKELTSMIGHEFEIENWWDEHWFPIFFHGSGSLICYDLKGVFTGESGQLVEFWHADTDRNVIAPDLRTFMESLNKYYKDTPVEHYNSYFDITGKLPKPKAFIVDKLIKKPGEK